MSYGIMEAMLVEKVRKLRETEDILLRSYLQVQTNPCNATTSALTMRLNHRSSGERDRATHGRNGASEESATDVPGVNS